MDNNKNIRSFESRINQNSYNNYSRYQTQYTKTNQPNNKYTRNYNNHNNADYKYKASVYSRNIGHKYNSKSIQHYRNKKKKNLIIKLGIVVIICVVIGIAIYQFYPIQVSINGQNQTLIFNKTIEKAVKQSEINVNPGNFIAVDYSIINQGQGKPFSATVNGQKVENINEKLHSGDMIEYNDGDDIMEDYDSVDSKIVAKSQIFGVGAIHKLSGTGEPGIWSKLTGKISGKQAERATTPPNDVTCKNVNINPGSDKVIALTFDDGPSTEYTQSILDILKQYNAKATFFVIGENIENDWGKKLISTADSQGHQICTHTYDHARPVGGVDITGMSDNKQIEEVTKGQELITNALGKPASKVVRLPGGNINATTTRLIAPYVTTEIGWNIDTQDWKKPGVSAITKQLNSASSGNVILCHDGGGDRSQTVSAIKEFLQAYTEKGYKFITIDELLKYSEAQDENSDQLIDSEENSTNYNKNSLYDY